MKILKIIILIVHVLLFIIIAYQLYKPNIIKPLLTLKFKGLHCETNGTVNDKITLYSKEGNNTLLVWIGGGGFIYSEQSYCTINYFHEKYKDIDILTFSYPVLFSNTVLDAMTYINNTVEKYSKPYKNIFLLGVSAGGLYAGLFCKKEQSSAIATRQGLKQLNLPIKGVIFSSAVLNINFDSILKPLFSFYMLRGVKYKTDWNCYNIQVPKLVITSVQDALSKQSTQYITSEKAESKIFPQSSTAHHSFIDNPTYDEAKESIDIIYKFITTHKS